MWKLQEQELSMRMTKKKLNEFGAMALALWEEYEESLPDAPGNMTRKLIRNLHDRGFYLSDHKLLDDNPKGAIERESNYQRGTQ